MERSLQALELGTIAKRAPGVIWGQGWACPNRNCAVKYDTEFASLEKKNPPEKDDERIAAEIRSRNECKSFPELALTRESQKASKTTTMTWPPKTVWTKSR